MNKFNIFKLKYIAKKPDISEYEIESFLNEIKKAKLIALDDNYYSEIEYINKKIIKKDKLLSIVFSVLAIISYVLIINKSCLGMYGWIISNTGMLYLAIKRWDIGQIILWLIYTILNVYGVITWS